MSYTIKGITALNPSLIIEGLDIYIDPNNPNTYPVDNNVYYDLIDNKEFRTNSPILTSSNIDTLKFLSFTNQVNLSSIINESYNSITLQFWVRNRKPYVSFNPPPWTGDDIVVSRFNSNSAYGSVFFSDGNIGYTFSNTISGSDLYLEEGVWNLLTYTFSGNEIHIYKNLERFDTVNNVSNFNCR